MGQPDGTPPPFHFTNSFSGGKNSNNFYTGTQNIIEGRDMNLNIGRPTMNINSYSSKDEGEEGEEDDKPFSEKRLRIQLRAFNRQRSELNETVLKEIDGQEHLDKWRRMIIALIFLASLRSLRVQDVGIQDLAPVPDMHFADVDVFKGKIGGMDVSVKAPKKQPRPDDKQLEVKGVAAGISHLHSQKFVHGDLNRFNIFIDSVGISRIGDLGLPQLSGKAAALLLCQLFGGTKMKGKDGPRRPWGMSNPMWDEVKKCLNTTPSSRPGASDRAEALSRYTSPVVACFDPQGPISKYVEFVRLNAL
ncbi:hypothetical protein PQX77_020988 [Marasmius sp. AFHP31]|nr:hypothetical protein PQX77_020988 [Marasmius sp. AFHP31]